MQREKHWPSTQSFHVVLVLMKANTRMNEHHVDGRISIHALEGRIRIRMSDEVVDVSAGELVTLDYAIPNDIEALEESAYLLTISWPGGTKEERHAWKRASRMGRPVSSRT